ncbi:MAG: exosortase H [Acidobacteriota bacterium]
MAKKSSKTRKADDGARSSAADGATEPSGWRRYRQEIVFVTVFVVILAGGFTLISWQPVNDRVIEPFTGGVAHASSIALNLIGQDTTLRGTGLSNDRFRVNIKNGCNGVETMIIFLAAVVAFPATWKAKAIGLTVGIVAIQAVNLIRVVALFLTGVYWPSLFDSSHTVIWQTIVILFGVLLWIFWAQRFAAPVPAAAD